MQSDHTAGWVPLLDSEGAVPTGSVWLGPVDPNEVVRCTVHVRPAIHDTQASSDHRQPWAARDDERSEDAGDSPGADPDDLDRIRDFAVRATLKIVETDAQSRRVVLSGTAAALSDAFRLQLARYKHAGTMRLGYISPIYLPAALAHAVEAIREFDVSPAPLPSVATPRAAWRAQSRRVVVPAVALVAGGALGIFIYGNVLPDHARPAPSPTARAPEPPAPASSPALLNTLQGLETSGWKLLEAGRVREAQDNFLRVLAVDPGRPKAMQGLVAVRRKIAGDNPGVIRQQVALYQDAITHGGAPGDNYTPSALKLLVAAGLRALREIEAQGERLAVSPQTSGAAAAVPNPPQPRPSPARTQDAPAQHPSHSATNATQPAPPVPALRPPQSASVPPKTQDRSTPAPAAEAQTPPAALPQPQKPFVTPVPQRPSVTGAPQSTPSASGAAAPAPAAPASQASAAAPRRLYTIRIGPVSDHDRASSIAKQLSARGFAQAQISPQAGYRVLSEPLPRNAAERLVAALAGRGIHGYVGASTGDTLQVIFGVFTSQRDAETLSGRIAAAGYDAWIREGTVYIVHVGPYPSDSVDAITEVVKAGAPEAAIAADPLPPQAGQASAVPGPQAPPAPSGAPAPSSPATSPASPAPQASPPAANRLYTVRIGPVSDRDRAAAIARQLAAAGFSQAQISPQTGYRVVSEPLPRKEAESVAAALLGRGIHSYVAPSSPDTAQLIFGIAASQKDAEALSSRISAAGYDVWIREATVYTVRVGPYSSASVNSITDLMKAGAPEAAVVADPVP
jgi:cell division protein FtsN